MMLSGPSVNAAAGLRLNPESAQLAPASGLLASRVSISLSPLASSAGRLFDAIEVRLEQ